MRASGGSALTAWLDVCADEDVWDERPVSFEVAGHRYLLLRIDGGLKALDGTCTHEEADLGIGFLAAGRITCPLHLSQFDLDTGEALTPPAELPLKVYPVKVEGGRVLIQTDAEGAE